VANTHLYYTGQRRSAVDVLRHQDQAIRRVSLEYTGGNGAGAPATVTAEPTARGVVDALLQIKDLGYRILEAIENEAYDEWGHLLHEHWCSKKRLSNRVSLERVDTLYEHVRQEYHVLGGKIVGAGGGGFVMLYCERDHKRLEAFMLEHGMPRLHYAMECEGSKVVANLASRPSLRTVPALSAREAEV
jgi:D-glycero-alpha-D-manno-heptose-7-phosphate kinase